VRAAAWGVSAFTLAYFLSEALGIPALLYDPITRAFRFTGESTGLAMRYFGDLLWASAAGALAAACGHLSAERLPAEKPLAAAAAAVGMVALAVAFYLSRLVAAV
jgi:hypothetical protein